MFTNLVPQCLLFPLIFIADCCVNIRTRLLLLVGRNGVDFRKRNQNLRAVPCFLRAWLATPQLTYDSKSTVD